MSRSPREYLLHILDEVRYLRSSSRGLELDAFLGDETLRRAFVRSIEIIGEASRYIQDDFRDRHPEIEWRAMVGMRDRLIHGYFGVDYNLVWDVVENKIPQLEGHVEALLADIEEEQGE